MVEPAKALDGRTLAPIEKLLITRRMSQGGKWPKSKLLGEGPTRHRDPATIVDGKRICVLPDKEKSAFTGVYWSKANKKWVARIRKDGKQIHLGCFDDED